MKKLFLSLLIAVTALGQTSAVYKNSANNQITGNLVVGDGKAVSATGTGTITATHVSGGAVSDIDYVQFDTAVTAAYAEGRVSWNAADHTIEVHTDDSGTRIQVGQEMVIRARNSTGATLANGKPVYVSGATGNRPTITLADADEETKSVNLIGLVTTTGGIANNADGYVTVFGLVRDVNTNSWNEGDTLYLATGAAGGLTNVKPTSGYVVRVGFVTIKNPSTGVILVAPQVSGSAYGDTLNLIASASAARTSLDVYSKAETDALTSTRTPSQSVLYFGTSGDTVTGLTAPGTGDFTVLAWPSVNALGTAQFVASSPDNGPEMFVETDGTIKFQKRGFVAVASTGKIAAQRPSMVAYVRAGTSGAFYLEGSASGTVSDSWDYTAALNTVGSRAAGVAALPFTGPLRVAYILGSSTAAEIAAAHRGQYPTWWFPSVAAGTQLNTDAFANRTYDTFSGASATGFTAVSSGGTKGAASGSFFSIGVGNKVRVPYTLTLNSGQAPYIDIENPGVTAYSSATQLTAGSGTIELTATSLASGTAKIGVFNTAASDYVITFGRIEFLGAQLFPDPSQPGVGNVFRSIGTAPGLITKSASNSWLIPTSQYERGEIDTRANSRATRQGLQLSGSQAGGSAKATIGAGSYTGPLEILSEFDAPLSSPAVARGIACVSSAGSFLNTRSTSVTIQPNGALLIYLIGATAGADFRTAQIANFVAQYAGQRVRLRYVKAATPEIWINGRQVSFTETTAGTPPAWSDSVTLQTLDVGTLGTDGYPNLGFCDAALILGNLTTDEARIWHNTGVLPQWCYVSGGAGANLSVGSWANSAAPYTIFTGASSSGFTAADSSGTKYAISANNFASRLGNRVLLTGSVAMNDGKTVAPFAMLATSGLLTLSNGLTLGTSGSFSVILEHNTGNASVTDVRILIGSVGDASFTVSNLKATNLGLAFQLDPRWDGRGGVGPDVSGAYGRGLVLGSGVTAAVPSLSGTNRILATSSTNGNQQLYGASIIPSVSQIVRVRARAASGTPTVTLGNASGGSQIVTSVALSTSWKNLTIASGGEITSTANLWAGSNSTDVVYWDIEVQSFNN